MFELGDGSALFVTVAKYRTPAGHEIDRVGITPDRACRWEHGWECVWECGSGWGGARRWGCAAGVCCVWEGTLLDWVESVETHKKCGRGGGLA